MKSLIFLFIIFLYASCGPREGALSEEDVLRESFSTEIQAGGQPFNESERAIAVRICSAYRRKADVFRTRLLGNAFNFSVTKMGCDGVERSANLQTRLLDRPSGLTFEGNFEGRVNAPSTPEITRLEIPLVQTDIIGALASICTSLSQNLAPVDVIEISNNQRMEITFNSQAGDGYLVRFAAQVIDDNPATADPFIVNRVEQYYVETNVTASGELLGLVSRINISERCPTTANREFTNINQIHLNL